MFLTKYLAENHALKIFSRSEKTYGQVIKGTGRMPWRQKPMKDGASTDMPREAASRH